MTNPLEALLDAFITCAAIRELSVQRSPSRALSARTHLDELLGAEAAQPPAGVDALEIDGHFLLFGVLSAELETQRDARTIRLRSLLAWAGTLRASLDTVQKDELTLILVGPVATETSATWMSFAHATERDERICRKLVWLPPEVAEFANAAVDFVGRTFLARPWDAATGERAVELDAGRRFELAVKAAAGVNASDVQVAAAWWPILTAELDADGEPVVPGAALVARLMASMRHDDK